KCERVRVQNNLVLEPQLEADMVLLDHRRGVRAQSRSGDLPALLNSPEWHFNHNWREIDELRANARYPGLLIPRGLGDQLKIPIKVLSRAPPPPDFLRPPKDSPLATGGAGVDDPTLPPYVGAVPPEG